MFFLRHLFLTIMVFALAEAVLLAKVGTAIGWGITILLIVSTALIGSIMLRQQGFETWMRLNQRMAKGEMPGQELIEGVLLLIGGALLVTPGFITDAIGFACLIPVSRKAFARWALKQGVLQAMSQGQSGGFWTYQQTYQKGPDGYYRSSAVYGHAEINRTEEDQHTGQEQPPSSEPAADGSANVIEGEFIARDERK